MIGSLLIFAVALVLLAVGAERVVASSDSIARRLRVSPFFYALTVVAFATSLPEIVVSAAHSIRGNPDLVVNDVMGSVLFNVTVVLGLALILRPPVVAYRTFIIIFRAALVTIVLVLVVIWNNRISRLEGVFLLGALIPLAAVFGRTQKAPVPTDLGEGRRWPWMKLASGVLILLIGTGVLLAGTDSLEGRTTLLLESSPIMGLLVLAISTSVPEAVTVLVATRRGRGDLVVGTLVGSCAVNLVIGLGVAAVVVDGGIAISPTVVRFVFPAMLFGTVLLVPTFRAAAEVSDRPDSVPAPKKLPHSRRGGCILLVAYVVLVWWILL